VVDDQAVSAYLALVGGTVYPSPVEEPIRGATVLVNGTTIAAVGPAATVPVPETARVLDCAGATITAGFWNSHVHFFEKKWEDAGTIPASELGQQLADMFGRYGFTTVFDISSQWRNTRLIRDRIESGGVPGPHIRSTGEALTAAGFPVDHLAILGWSPATIGVSGVADAIAVSRRLLDDGVDAIKLHLHPPPPPRSPLPVAVVAAVAEQTHQHGKPVFLHPHDNADVVAAAKAGVDILAHTTPMSEPWDERVLSAMHEARIALTPTLVVWQRLLRSHRMSRLQRIAETTIGQLRAWAGSGGTVLFGTDVGAIEYDPADEYQMMAEAGMTVRQLLAALTTTPAERFGDSRRLGRVTAGYQADLVVLAADPVQDIRALTQVRHTLRAGRIIY
jgi:cytosine/adenosine deaminase-related metal-dependent hydrolase